MIAGGASPRRLVVLGLLAVSLIVAGEAGAVEQSTFFSTAFTEYSDTLDTASDGDLWASCWSDDGNLYAANGDGRGFGLGEPFSDIVVNRIFGTPETGITGERLAAGDELGTIWANPERYNRKPTGMVCVDGDGDGSGELYLAVQDLRTPPCPPCFNDAPNASISRSDDHGETWQKTSAPMFPDYRFTTIFFLDFGKNSENASQALGPEDGSYVYAYGLDWNWRDSFSDTVPDPTDLYLARVPKDRIQDRAAWEFYAGNRPNGRPVWTADMGDRIPVLHDERRVYPTLRRDGVKNMTVLSQGSVVYNEPLDRYIYTSWTEYTFEFYEAPRPWGPWKLFMRKDFGGYPWFGNPGPPGCPGPKNGGYATTVPSKFISGDGKTMWLQSNWFVGVACGPPNYNFSFRRFVVEPFVRTTATNKPDPERNLARVDGTTPIEKSAHFGRGDFYNDGVRNQNEDSFDWENKLVDFWGYTWKQAFNLDRVVYTTGNMFFDGGWFSADLRVQVRQNFDWVDVTGLAITPRYPFDGTAGPNRTFTLTFADTRGDGVRIIGRPGGSAFFTSVGELEVYYDDRGARASPPATSIAGPVSEP